MAFKMAPRSPLMKSLKGGQKNLPEGLKKAIEAAPGKMMDSPAKMGRGERYDVKMASDQNLTAGARKNYAENAEAAQKSSPAKETDPKKAIKAAQAGKAKKKIATPKQLESRAEIKRTVGKLARKAAPKSKKIATPTELDARRKNTAAKGAAAKASRKADGDKKPMPPTGDSPAKNMNKGYGSPAKMKASPMKVKSGAIPSKDATGTSRVMGPPHAISLEVRADRNDKPSASKPKYDKELNGLVASRKGLKKGTNEYNKVQNQINKKLGNSKRYKVETAKKPTAPKISDAQAAQFEGALAKGNTAGPMGSEKGSGAPRTNANTSQKTNAKDSKSVNVKQTAAGTTMTTRTGGGANKGGTTERRRVNGKIDKTVTKTADTRTVTTRRKGTDSADNPVTKTTKRLGKGRIKEAIANRKAKIQATRAAKTKSTMRNKGQGSSATEAKSTMRNKGQG